MPRSVEDICKVLVKNSKLVANCNEFLQEVARQVGNDYQMPDLAKAFAGKADDVRARFGSKDKTQAPFVYIGPHPNKATEYATAGQFVVGGLTHTEMTYTTAGKKEGEKIEHKATMGHVVVVVPGGPSKRGFVTLTDETEMAVRGGYPYCYQGAHVERFRFQERTQVDAVFPSLLLNKVIYGYIELAKT